MFPTAPPPVLAPDPWPGSHAKATIDPRPYVLTLHAHGVTWRCTVRPHHPCWFRRQP